MTNTKDKPVKATKQSNLSTKVFGYGTILFFAACTIRMFMLEADNLRNDDKLFAGAVIIIAGIIVAYGFQAIVNLVKSK